MIGDADIGQRVVVRRFVGIGVEGRPQYTDVLGELTSFGPERLTVRSADGTEHTMARADVVAAKPVPPRPARYSEILALEWAAASTWPAPVQHRIGDWLLRAAEGWTARGNSALPLGDPGLPMAEAIDAVRAWYADLGLPPAITTPLPVCRTVHDALRERGWLAQPTTLVLTVALSELLEAVAPEDLARVALPSRPSAGFLALVAGRKNGLPASAHHVLSAVGQVRFAEVYAGTPAGLVAIARGALSQDGRWLGVSLVEVVEGHRRRGLARQVTGALAAWAAGRGATMAFLQVLESNTAARALYERLGFGTHHRYVTLTPPDPSRSG